MTNNQDFNTRSRDAIEQMKQMYSRSTGNEPVQHNHARQHNPNPTPSSNSLLSGLGLPFLDSLKTDGDMTLILGILLLLLSEKADKRLLFALIYILF